MAMDVAVGAADDHRAMWLRAGLADVRGNGHCSWSLLVLVATANARETRQQLGRKVTRRDDQCCPRLAGASGLRDCAASAARNRLGSGGRATPCAEWQAALALPSRDASP